MNTVSNGNTDSTILVRIRSYLEPHDPRQALVVSVNRVFGAPIRSALERFLRDRTGLWIADLAATVHKADKILVIDDRRVAAEGSHEALLCPSECYQRCYELQVSG